MPIIPIPPQIVSELDGRVLRVIAIAIPVPIPLVRDLVPTGLYPSRYGRRPHQPKELVVVVRVVLPLFVTLKLVTHKLVHERLGVANTRVDVEHFRVPISGGAAARELFDQILHAGHACKN